MVRLHGGADVMQRLCPALLPGRFSGIHDRDGDDRDQAKQTRTDGDGIGEAAASRMGRLPPENFLVVHVVLFSKTQQCDGWASGVYQTV